ncbi:MAG: hypothetical protein KU37_04995 [Sulfuricurvum sp. PC08-66]|nr:MAG: hypothetical protein KU37_04995 [Sulfuricurvum sp. PC08-66]
MRHFWGLFFITLLGNFAYAKGYTLYPECEEYYDSRGFYHNECEEAKLGVREGLRTLDQLSTIIQPNSPDNNETQAPTSTLAEPDIKLTDEAKGKALAEKPELEFGRQ